MKFEIRSTKNGAVLRVEHDYPEGETEEICYQETEHGEIEAFADFLRYLDDHYGPTTGRYSPKRIYISVKHRATDIPTLARTIINFYEPNRCCF